MYRKPKVHLVIITSTVYNFFKVDKVFANTVGSREKAEKRAERLNKIYTNTKCEFIAYVITKKVILNPSESLFYISEPFRTNTRK